ncbi:MAG: hypothetical protein V4733_09405 [Verrucomicrobiota bacterium]
MNFRALVAACSAMLAAAELGAHEDVKTTLRFLVSQAVERKGVQMTGAPHLAENPPKKGSFFLHSHGKFVRVEFSEGRRTPEFAYEGPRRCPIYKAGKDGSSGFDKIGEVLLPTSSQCTVWLTPNSATNFSAVALPHGDDALKKGWILLLNQTGDKLVLRVDGKNRAVLNKGKTKAIPVRAADGSSLHFSVSSRPPGQKERLEFSREYVVIKNSKSACIFYRTVENGPVDVKMLSGLDH